MIPKDGWQPMSTAPTNGEIIMCKSREWDNPNGSPQVQPGQWLCNLRGADWRWRLSGRQGTTIFADGWMSFAAFHAAQTAEGFTNQQSALGVEPVQPKPTAPKANFEAKFKKFFEENPLPVPPVDFDL